MIYTTSSPWLSDFVLTATIIRSGLASQFYRSARAGHFVRLASGVYFPAVVWAGLSADDRFLVRVHAVALASQPGNVFSHYSAAALWRLPLVGAWPGKPEVVVGVGATGRTRRSFAARKYALPLEPDVIDGVTVTPLARTVVDMGRVAPLSVSVPMIDRALAVKKSGAAALPVSIAPADLASEVRAISSTRGMARCGRAIELADGLSGSPGESLSRVAIHVLGLPAPVLQYPFYDAHGLVGIVDFWWPDFDLIGEFDGHGKYLREDLLGGQSTADAVIAEKRREDRLRALGPRVCRWGWAEARSLPRLSAHLAQAGLR